MASSWTGALSLLAPIYALASWMSVCTLQTGSVCGMWRFNTRPFGTDTNGFVETWFTAQQRVRLEGSAVFVKGGTLLRDMCSNGTTTTSTTTQA